jgi:DNA-binding GntR family transcriptional regulator
MTGVPQPHGAGDRDRPWAADGIWADWEKELSEAIEVRQYLDSMAAKRAAGRLDRHDLGRLRRAVAALARAVEAGRPGEIQRADRQIHTLIYGAGGGDVLEHLLQPVNDVVTLLSPQTLAVDARARVVLDEHRNLLAALEAHDVVGAEHWSMEHLKSARLAALDMSWTWARRDPSIVRGWILSPGHPRASARLE